MMEMHLPLNMRQECKKMKEPKNSSLSVRDIALLGMLIATLEVGKIALNAVPNVEVVTLLIILYTLQFGKKTIYAVIVFVLLECAMWGIGLWTIMYMYIWPLLSIVVYFLRKLDSIWFWSIFAGIFGLMFGALSSIVYLFMGGFQTAFAWWIAGIPWDLVHGISNLIIMAVLYIPLRALLKKLSHLSLQR